MKLTFTNGLEKLNDSKFLLLAIASSLIALYLLLTFKVLSDIDRTIMDMIFWGSILLLLRRKEAELILKSSSISKAVGIVLIAFVLAKSISLFAFEVYFLRVMPLFIFLGVALLASGFKGLKQYWREFIIIIIMLANPVRILALLENTLSVGEIYEKVTAHFSGFLLYYLGFNSLSQGNYITLPHGTVLVGLPCTGFSSGLMLLQLCAVLMVVFPLNWGKQISLPLAAVLLAFVVGGLRVALLALVVSNPEQFEFWHGSEGNQIFSTLTILLFGFMCNYLFQIGSLESHQQGKQI